MVNVRSWSLLPPLERLLHVSAMPFLEHGWGMPFFRPSHPPLGATVGKEKAEAPRRLVAQTWLPHGLGFF